MKILLLGAHGQLGRELKRSLSILGEVISLTRESFDFTHLSRVKEQVLFEKPAVIVNAAAYNDIMGAENDRKLCTTINVELPRVLAQTAQKLDSQLFHFSCVDVYGNDNQDPHVEDDEPAPKSFWAESKLQGEQAIEELCERHYIFRLSWLYSNDCALVNQLLKSAGQNKLVKLPVDQIGAPTPTRYIADVIGTGLGRMHRRVLKIRPGIYNLSTKGETSRSNFAREVLKAHSQLPLVEAIPAHTYPDQVRRPLNARLNVQKFEDSFCVNVPSWSSQLHTVFSVPADQSGNPKISPQRL